MCGEKSSFRSMNVSLTLVFFGAICSNLRPLAPRKFPIFFQKFVFRDDVKRQKKPPNSDCLKKKFCVCSTLKLHSGLLDTYIILHKEEDRHLKFHTIRYRTKSYTLKSNMSSNWHKSVKCSLIIFGKNYSLFTVLRIF